MRQKEVHPNGDNTSLEELEVAMGASPTKQGFQRLSAIRALLLGFSREDVCKLYLVKDRPLRCWIHWFNEAGVDGLISRRKKTGRPRIIKLQRLEDILIPVLEDPSLEDQLHWTGRKMHGWLKEKLKLELSYSTVIRYLHEVGYVLRFPRPWATGPGKDEEHRERFKTEISALKERDDVRIWFADETGIEGDPRPRQRWAKRGSDPKVDYHGGHLRRTVIGAVQPDSGKFFSAMFCHCNTDVFQVWLNEFALDHPPEEGKQDIVILDNASWHKVKRLNWHHFTPMYLPAYSPDLNPIERLWKSLKDQWFTDFYTRDGAELEERVLTALSAMHEKPVSVAKTTAFR
mgnify:CR=1 FL=1